jgi:hypothetical protein
MVREVGFSVKWLPDPLVVRRGFLGGVERIAGQRLGDPLVRQHGGEPPRRAGRDVLVLVPQQGDQSVRGGRSPDRHEAVQRGDVVVSNRASQYVNGEVTHAFQRLPGLRCVAGSSPEEHGRSGNVGRRERVRRGGPALGGAAVHDLVFEEAEHDGGDRPGAGSGGAEPADHGRVGEVLGERLDDAPNKVLVDRLDLAQAGQCGR